MISLAAHASNMFEYCIGDVENLTDAILIDAIDYTTMAIGRHAYRLEMTRSQITAWVKTHYNSVFYVAGKKLPLAMPEVLWRVLHAWMAQKDMMEEGKDISDAFPDYNRLHRFFVKNDARLEKKQL